MLKQEFLIYHGTGISNTTNQPSGAYIFRPNGTISFPIASNITYNVVEVYIIICFISPISHIKVRKLDHRPFF